MPCNQSQTRHPSLRRKGALFTTGNSSVHVGQPQAPSKTNTSATSKDNRHKLHSNPARNASVHKMLFELPQTAPSIRSNKNNTAPTEGHAVDLGEHEGHHAVQPVAAHVQQLHVPAKPIGKHRDYERGKTIHPNVALERHSTVHAQTPSSNAQHKQHGTNNAIKSRVPTRTSEATAQNQSGSTASTGHAHTNRSQYNGRLCARGAAAGPTHDVRVAMNDKSDNSKNEAS